MPKFPRRIYDPDKMAPDEIPCKRCGLFFSSTAEFFPPDPSCEVAL